jgi:hypothetical protein
MDRAVLVAALRELQDDGEAIATVLALVCEILDGDDEKNASDCEQNLQTGAGVCDSSEHGEAKLPPPDRAGVRGLR